MTLPDPQLAFAFEIRADIGPFLRIGRSADEELTFTPVTGGSVAGPLLNGTIVAGGGDWAVERSRTAQLEARYVVQADDGAYIDVLNRGYYRASKEVIDRVEAGENVPETEYYFRTAPVFQTDAAPHRWLAEHQFVGLARDEDGQVRVRVFLVK
ncbi:DUF3237 domain-containing protein [Microbacterium sp. KR10-403]|uniref:DUF3237 domain-containing protein n=1 Tax=Microbacterium sp. KR10-403 TaxID=3158581 RepID=UPI0032E4DED0